LKYFAERSTDAVPPFPAARLRQGKTAGSKTEILVLQIPKGQTLKNLRYSDLYRNIQHYLKHNECSHDFTGTRQWLGKYLHDQNRINTVIAKIKSSGASCDCEILSKVKPHLNGRTLLVALD